MRKSTLFEAMELQALSLDKVQKNPGILVIGKRRAGKTTLIKEFIKAGVLSEEIFAVVAPGETTAQHYKGVVSDDRVHDAGFVAKLEELINTQRDDVSKTPRGVVLDGCMYELGSLRSKAYHALVFNSRNLRIPYVLSVQYCLELSPTIRNYFDYVFLFRDDNIENKQRLFKYFCGMFDTFETFNQTFDKYTAGHGCLVVDNTSRSNKIEDQVFYFQSQFEKAAKPEANPPIGFFARFLSFFW